MLDYPPTEFEPTPSYDLGVELLEICILCLAQSVYSILIWRCENFTSLERYEKIAGNIFHYASNSLAFSSKWKRPCNKMRSCIMPV